VQGKTLVNAFILAYVSHEGLTLMRPSESLGLILEGRRNHYGFQHKKK